MNAAKLDLDLESLLAKDSINNNDVLEYVKSIVQLSRMDDQSFQKYRHIFQKRIQAFQTIFSGEKMDGTASKCLSKSCGLFTEVFLKLMPSFTNHEPDYTQEFYFHWKVIISRMSAPARAKTFRRNVQQFKNLIENLRTSTHRINQIAILSILLLYFEGVESHEMSDLKQRNNDYITDKLTDLKSEPTTMKQHSFLHNINGMGRSIISLEPTKIICERLSLTFDTSSCALWIDFNLRDKSITLVAVSTAENSVTCLATVHSPQFKEKIREEHVLQIRGTWSMVTKDPNPIQKKTIMKVYLPINDRNAVWKAKVKSLFSFVPGTSIFSQSISQVCPSEPIDRRLTKFVVDDVGIATASQNDELETSFSLSFFTNKNPITPIDEKQLEDDKNKSFVSTKEWIDNTPNPAVNLSLVETERCFTIPISPSIIGESSGISFGDDMSVAHHGESENEMNENAWKQSNENIDKIERSETGAGPCSQRSFSSTRSSLQLNEHVKNFMEEPSTQTFSTEKPMIQIHDSLPRSIGMISSQEAKNDKFNMIPQPTQYINRSRKTTLSPQYVNEKHEKLLQPSISHVSSQESMKSQAKQSAPKEYGDDVVQTIRDVDKDSPQHNTVLYDDTDTYEAVDDVNEITDYNIEDEQDENPKKAEHKINEEGMVCDELGCVFINEDEFQTAYYVYIENNGLAYLESEAFKAANATRRKRSEREFRVISKIINRRFASPRQNFEDDAQSSNESVHTARGTAKRKSSWTSSSNGNSPAQPFKKLQKRVSNESSDSEMLSNESHVQTPQNNTTRINSINEANADVSNYSSDDEPQNLKYVSELQKNNESKNAGCEVIPSSPLVIYLKDFIVEREVCDLHNVLLVQLINDLQATIQPKKKIASSTELFSTTVSNIKTICQQARANAAIILKHATKI